ncbi:hypothetical protein Tco_0387449 [Tanacetum coccineum]
MTSDDNTSGLRFQDHNNEPSSLKLVPNVSPSADTIDPSLQDLKLLFSPIQHFDYHWTKDHPLEQVRGNPSKPVQIRRQLSTDPEMSMFVFTVSTAEPKNIKESMDDHA